jgi:hypothetical protein
VDVKAVGLLNQGASTALLQRHVGTFGSKKLAPDPRSEACRCIEHDPPKQSQRINIERLATAMHPAKDPTSREHVISVLPTCKSITLQHACSRVAPNDRKERQSSSQIHQLEKETFTNKAQVSVQAIKHALEE